MHVKQLVGVAGWAAAHAQELLHGESPLPESALQQYWVASKCRIQRWTEALGRFRPAGGSIPEGFPSIGPEGAGATAARPSGGLPPKGKVASHWPRLLANLEEILLSELLSRVWAAMLTAYDQRHGLQQASPLARNILRDHLEVRSRLLHLLLQPNEHLAQEVQRLNQLRNQVERWTDLLLAALAELVPGRQFAFEPSRMEDFAEDFSLRSPPHCRQQAWKLALATLRESFQSAHLTPLSANPDLNQRIAQAVLECLPKELSLWTLEDESVWYVQMDIYTGQLENLLENLLADT